MTEANTAAKAKRIAASNDRIEALRLKAEQAQNLLRQAEKIQAERTRASDTRRKIIVGAIILDALAKGTPVPRNFDEMMARVTRENDRAAFEGWSPADYISDDKAPSRRRSAKPNHGEEIEPETSTNSGTA